MALEQYVNNASTNLDGAINNSVTALDVVSSGDFPSHGNFRIKIDNEILLVTGVSGTTFTVVRGVESTTANSHADATKVEHVLTASSLREIIRRESWRPYPAFNPGTYDDEFDDENFSGWTLVEFGPATVSIQEKNSVLSVLHPGGDNSGQLHAIMKSASLSVGDYIEVCVRDMGTDQNYNIFGLLFADGVTVGSGQQVACYYSPNEQRFMMSAPAGYTAAATSFYNYCIAQYRTGFTFLRLKYESTNNWACYISSDGQQWINITGTLFSQALTPTHIGFFVSTLLGSSPHIFSFEYFKKGS